VNGKLVPYISIEFNLRIRGLKPSILYVHYTNLRFDNTLESIYIVDAEEAQCIWAKKIIERVHNMPKMELFINTMTESSWCVWEDKILSGQNIIPLKHLYGYRDVLNNTFIHCIAYACTYKESLDIDEIEQQFQAFHFATHPDMLELNELGETPLKILLGNEKLIPFVESILLRMNPETRLLALDFSNWHPSWGTLLNSVVALNLPQIINSTKHMQGFLSVFMFLTHNNEEAFISLFQAGYKIQYKHLFLEKLTTTQKHLISQAVRVVPTWYNLSAWMNLISENNSPEKLYKKLQKYLIIRNNLIKEHIFMTNRMED
jgi:hypothetical protein